MVSTLPPGVEPISMEGLECLVRLRTFVGSFGGSDWEPYEYYAIRESGVEKVSVEAVKVIAPEMVIDDEYRSRGYGNEGTARWYVQLMYAPQVERFDSERFMYRHEHWLPTDFGENVRIYYHEIWPTSEHWPEMKDDAEPEIEKAMLQVAYALFTEDLEKYTAGNELAWALTSFVVTANGETIFAEDRENNLYRLMPDGTFQLLIEMSYSLNHIEYFWFPEN